MYATNTQYPVMIIPVDVWKDFGKHLGGNSGNPPGENFGSITTYASAILYGTKSTASSVTGSVSSLILLTLRFNILYLAAETI